MGLHKLIAYSLLYMDNAGITANSSEEIVSRYRKLEEIFDPYKFKLQQFVTNDRSLNSLLGNSKSGNAKFWVFLGILKLTNLVLLKFC